MHGFAHPQASSGFFALVALTCGSALSFSASSQAIDPHATSATLGAPISMEVRVRHAAAPQTLLTSRCIEAELVIGDQYIGPEELQITLHPDPQQGWQRARVTHPMALQEPLIQAKFTVRCGASFTREFPVLGDPPGTKPLSLSGSATTRKLSIQRRTPYQSGDSRGATGTESAPIHGADASALTDRPGVERAAPPEPTQRAGGFATELNTVNSTPPASKWLLEQLQRLQEEHRRTQTQLSSLQARLAQRERDNNRLAWPWTLGILCLVLLILGRVAKDAWRWQRPVWGRDTARGAARQSPAKATEQPANPEPLVAIAVPPTAEPHAPMEDLAVGTEKRRQWLHADFGEASLDNPPDPEYLRQLESYMARGFPGATVVMVEKSLQDGAAKNPWYLLIILDIYSALGQRTNQEGVAAQLEALYNVQIAVANGLPAEGRDLLAQPATLTRVCECWNDSRAVEAIEALLLQPITLESLDLAAFRDVLLLHAIAKMNATPDATSLDFNPLIDWISPNS